MVRYAAKQIQEVTSAQVYGGLKIDWRSLEFSSVMVQELVDEFKYFQPLIYKGTVHASVFPAVAQRLIFSPLRVPKII